jgi:hypothetical protein
VTVNPLVAARVDAPSDRWAGVWIAEDIELINKGVRGGSWVDGSLGVVGAGLDGLALVSDPVGTLLQYGVSWIIEHVRPLSQALDWLAGDPAQIAGNAQTWRAVASSLHGQADGLAAAVRTDITDWRGAAAAAYRDWSGQQQAASRGLATAAETMAAVTEGAGFLIAAVRVLVRDAVATCVSRLIVYAVEEVASFGLATPLVVEQVSTLVAAWAAKIARWLRALLASLRELMPVIRRLGELIDELKKILTRLRGRGEPTVGGPHRGRSREDLIAELERNGVRYNPDDIVAIGTDGTGKIIFLENGTSRAGLRHIVERHATDFANVGIPQDRIVDLVFSAVTTGKVVGMQRTRPIYEVVFDGQVCRLAVTVGDNGFIVGANPVG